MSLEAVIQENTNVMRELIALWKTGASPAPAPTPADTKGKTETAKVETAKVETAKAEPAKTETGKADTKAADVTYDTIKPLIIKYNQVKGRDAATALLAEFNVTRGPELKAEQYAAFHKRIVELMA